MSSRSRDTSDPPKQITNRYGEIYLCWENNEITPREYHILLDEEGRLLTCVTQ